LLVYFGEKHVENFTYRNQKPCADRLSNLVHGTGSIKTVMGGVKGGAAVGGM
jgi:hypothetical protein